ncbi:TraE/TraK family type IV conjugative transfer system protein (plasmid) [Aliarcobacter lanthieri]|uniref:TraE/TraK family type IV conjugative transfer system protein n=1 Tax=Aliarcobacter lanthieri TaxID=1355374 RepID=UPI003AAFB44B
MSDFLDGLTNKYKSFFNGKFVNQIKNLELALKILIGIVIFQCLINFLMLNYVVKASINKEIVFSVNKNTLEEGYIYKVNKNTASRSYFETIGYGVMHELTSFNYQTVQNKSNWALSMVHPDNYVKIYEELSEDTKFAIENRVSQDFNIKDWKYKQLNSSSAKITALGTLTRTVGGIAVVTNEQYEASVIITISNYSPFIVALDLDYKDRKRKDRETRQKEIDNLDKKDVKGIKDEKIKK